MSFSVTALQLINRVNRRRRICDSTGVTELEDLATLDAVNRAVDEVLAARRWEFDIRHTQLSLRGRKTSVAVTVSAGNSSGAVQAADLVLADTVGDYITRVIPGGSGSYSDTSIRLVTGAAPIATFSSFTTSTAIPEAISTSDGELVYSEYMLPDTVSNVVAVTHQEDTLKLEEVGAKVEFSDLYPRPHIEYGKPQVVSVGGSDVSTYEAGESAPSPRLKMTIWPVPDADYVIDYTYDYRHPSMSAATDTLDGVPPEVVDLIVDIATSDMQANFDRRVDDALKLRRDTKSTMEEIHDRHEGMYAERAVVGNWDSRGGRNYRHSIHQGRLIGGS